MQGPPSGQEREASMQQAQRAQAQCWKVISSHPNEMRQSHTEM